MQSTYEPITPVSITKAAKEGMLLNLTTCEPTHNRMQVYRIMEMGGVDELTEEFIMEWNERVAYVHNIKMRQKL